MSVVLVTGGAGYIGSHAVKALRERGETVVVYDNFSQGHRAAAARASALVEGDIHDTARLKATIEAHRPDAVMHFAAWLSVGDSVKNPVGYYHNNVTGALSGSPTRYSEMRSAALCAAGAVHVTVSGWVRDEKELLFS